MNNVDAYKIYELGMQLIEECGVKPDADAYQWLLDNMERIRNAITALHPTKEQRKFSVRFRSEASEERIGMVLWFFRDKPAVNREITAVE